MKYEYDTDAYLKQISNSNSYFNTFLDKKSLAAGVLSLDPGEEDTQEPHESDEMYYVLKGNGFLRINKNDYKLIIKYLNDFDAYFWSCFRAFSNLEKHL